METNMYRAALVLIRNKDRYFYYRYPCKVIREFYLINDSDPGSMLPNL
jgi:hypothetical protein